MAGEYQNLPYELRDASVQLSLTADARRRRLELRHFRAEAPPANNDENISRPSSGSSAREGMHVNVRVPRMSHGIVSLVGRRREMEDAVTVAPAFKVDFGNGGEAVPGMSYDFYGVYDGHGGLAVAQTCQDRLHVVLAEEVEAGGWPTTEACWRDAMVASFSKVDKEVSEMAIGDAERSVGSTAVVAVVCPKLIVVANCGDSRAVLSSGGRAVPLSFDHKPDRPDEMERVEAAGGRVIDWDGSRVLGVLATSRSIGDDYLKPYVIPEPEVTVTERTVRDEFIILASDGLWDVMTSEAACKLVRKCLTGRMERNYLDKPTPYDAATVLGEYAMTRGSKDNISVVVVELKRLRLRPSIIPHSTSRV